MKPAWTCGLCHTADFPRSKKKRGLCELCYDGLEARSLAWCSKGHRVKALDMAQGKAWCKVCERQRNDKYGRSRAAYAREWRAEHPEAGKVYRNKNRVRYNEQKRRRYWADPEAGRAYSKEQYQKHRANKMQSARLWRVRNRALSRAHARQSYQRRKLRVFSSLLKFR